MKEIVNIYIYYIYIYIYIHIRRMHAYIHKIKDYDVKKDSGKQIGLNFKCHCERIMSYQKGNGTFSKYLVIALTSLSLPAFFFKLPPPAAFLIIFCCRYMTDYNKK